MIASAISDLLIVVALATGNAEWTGWLVTFSSSLILVLLGLISGNPSAAGVATVDQAAEAAPPPPETSEEDLEVMNALEAFLKRDPLHLDPNLTLSRLARRMHVPEKRLSTAVNRATGANVSRYINRWRIRHACQRSEDGATVTDARLESGFNTKSNFNREFLRETAMSPSRWKRESGSGSNVANLSEAGRGQ